MTGRAMRLVLVLVFAAGSWAVAAPRPVSAAVVPKPMPVIANYQMNESSSAGTMNDSGPHDLDGSIGSLVTTNASHAGATGYRFNASSPTKIPADTERLVTVPDDDALDFGTSDFAVEFRYRSTVSWGNVVQKGQNQTFGGYFKFEQPKGEMTCLVKDAEGDQIAARAPAEHATNDGDWHVIRCEKTKKMIRLFVDGVRVAQTTKSDPDDWIESVSNGKVLSIGGKYSCDQNDVTCDYFNGSIDYVKIEKEGGSGPVNEPPNGSFTYSCDELECDFDSSASNDPDGTIVSRNWDFGDGTSGSGKAPSHTFATGGTYEVSLTVTDDDGAGDVVEKTVDVNRAPTAQFGVTCDQLACAFDSSASSDTDGTIVSRSWTFGDGATATTTTPTHVYAGPGPFTVQLVVTDDDGATATTTRDIEPTANVAPAAVFSRTCANLVCTFDSSASVDVDGSITSRSWNFGDGATATTTTATHTYQTPGTYLVRLVVTDDDGATSVASQPVTVQDSSSGPPVPAGSSALTGVTPFRLFDTRPGEPAPGPKGPVSGGDVIEVDVAGVGTVPGDVTAIAVNLTVVAIDAPSYVTVWPTGGDRPTTLSSLNVVSPGSTRANLAVIPVGDDGTISLYTLRDAHLLGDVVGYFTASGATEAGRIITLSPTRLFDTRPGSDPGPKGRLPENGEIEVDVAGQAGVPVDAAAVILNVTVTESTDASFVTVWPDGDRPATSSVNVDGAGQTAANMVIVPIGADGKFRIYSKAATHVLADVLGYVTGASTPSETTGLFVPLDPNRVFDTRPGESAPGPKGLIDAGTSITPQIASVGGIPSTAGGVVLNITYISTAPGYITMWPTGEPRTQTSNVNASAPGDVRANGAILRLGSGGDLDVYALTAAHVLADAFGYLVD